MSRPTKRFKHALIDPYDPKLTWFGAVSLQRTDDGVMPWRLPVREVGLFAPELHFAAQKPTGVRIGFRTNSESVSIRFSAEWADVPDPGKIDLCCNGVLVGSESIRDTEEIVFTGLKAGEKAIEIWLSPRARMKIKHIRLDIGATLKRASARRAKWITYGSSITQCGAAASPVETWPAIVAREMGLDLTNLGYGGQCHLDTMVARMIRGLPAHFISICAGANINGQSSLGPRTFRPAIVGFVSIIREGHPKIPITVMSPIWSLSRETTKNAVGFTIPDMRKELALAVETLRAHGDQNIHYVDGLDILGKDQENRLPDRLHPDAEGYRIMGANFLKKVVKPLFNSGVHLHSRPRG